MSPFKSVTLWGLVLLGCCAPHVYGLTTDRLQAITTHSDEAEHDESQGTFTYAGNVVMQQGSMRINADKVVIYYEKDKVSKIIAQGAPARYEQKPNQREGLVVAKANTLEYDIGAETLRLIDGASLQQEGTSLSGNFINYDVKKSVVKAGGSADDNQRVRMVIPANSLNQGDRE